MLKGIWIEGNATGSPPRSHNLVELARAVGLTPSSSQHETLDDLTTE
jgi:hypothetical protein